MNNYVRNTLTERTARKVVIFGKEDLEAVCCFRLAKPINKAFIKRCVCVCVGVCVWVCVCVCVCVP